MWKYRNSFKFQPGKSNLFLRLTCSKKNAKMSICHKQNTTLQLFIKSSLSSDLNCLRSTGMFLSVWLALLIVFEWRWNLSRLSPNLHKATSSSWPANRTAVTCEFHSSPLASAKTINWLMKVNIRGLIQVTHAFTELCAVRFRKVTDVCWIMIEQENAI